MKYLATCGHEVERDTVKKNAVCFDCRQQKKKRYPEHKKARAQILPSVSEWFESTPIGQNLKSGTLKLK